MTCMLEKFNVLIVFKMERSRPKFVIGGDLFQFTTLRIVCMNISVVRI